MKVIKSWYRCRCQTLEQHATRKCGLVVEKIFEDIYDDSNDNFKGQIRVFLTSTHTTREIGILLGTTKLHLSHQMWNQEAWCTTIMLSIRPLQRCCNLCFSLLDCRRSYGYYISRLVTFIWRSNMYSTSFEKWRRIWRSHGKLLTLNFSFLQHVNSLRPCLTLVVSFKLANTIKIPVTVEKKQIILSSNFPQDVLEHFKNSNKGAPH